MVEINPLKILVENELQDQVDHLLSTHDFWDGYYDEGLLDEEDIARIQTMTAEVKVFEEE